MTQDPTDKARDLEQIIDSMLIHHAQGEDIIEELAELEALIDKAEKRARENLWIYIQSLYSDDGDFDFVKFKVEKQLEGDSNE